MSTNDLSPTALQINRIFKSPRHRVWTAWCDPDLAKQWWGPDGCETLELIVDGRVGGKYRWVLRTPDGTEMQANGEYRAVQPGERLVYTWHWEDDPEWENHDSVVTVEFMEKDPTTTELHLTHRDLPSEASRDNHIGGWNSALDRLEKLL